MTASRLENSLERRTLHVNHLIAKQETHMTGYELSRTLPMLLTKIARGMRSVNFSIC